MARRVVVAITATGAALGMVAGPPALAKGDSDNPLAASWPLNEGAGQTTRDVSGNGNHGVLGSSTAVEAADPTWIQLPGTRWYAPRALRFDGADYVTVADAPSLEPANLSVGAVVRAPTSPGAYRYVVSKGALQCVAASYGLYTGPDGGIRFYVSNGSQYVLSADAGRAVWDGAWHVVLGTYDGSSVRLFVDGREIGAAVPAALTLTYGFPDGDNLYLGDYRGTCASPLGFVGDIRAAAVANRAYQWSGG